MKPLFVIFLGLWASAGLAQTLDFPSNANLQLEVISEIDSYDMPVGVWTTDGVPVQTVEGTLTQQAWRIEASGLTTLQLLKPLREQLREARFSVIFECQTEACGGFDFRFGTQTLKPPEMQINIGDFRYLAGRRIGADGFEYISLFVSRTAQAGYVQITRVGPPRPDNVIATTNAAPLHSAAVPLATIAAKLENIGYAVLPDLTFQPGSSQLGDEPFTSLRALAAYLNDHPEQTVALVGHTDSSGSLDANIALSKRRAGSVLERLVSDYGASRRQLAAEGMGYLAPIATNQTEEGREANRRVTVVITSTDDS